MKLPPDISIEVCDISNFEFNDDSDYNLEYIKKLIETNYVMLSLKGFLWVQLHAIAMWTLVPSLILYANTSRDYCTTSRPFKEH